MKSTRDVEMENSRSSGFAAMPATVLCRLCVTEQDKKHACSLISNNAVKERLSQRMGLLLGINIDLETEFSTYVCRPCKQQFDHIERALAKLEKFKAMAKRSNGLFESRRSKRTKQCSGNIGVSPEILRIRPASKRQPLARRQLDFVSGKTL